MEGGSAGNHGVVWGGDNAVSAIRPLVGMPVPIRERLFTEPVRGGSADVGLLAKPTMKGYRLRNSGLGQGNAGMWPE